MTRRTLPDTIRTERDTQGCCFHLEKKNMELQNSKAVGMFVFHRGVEMSPPVDFLETA